MVEVITLGHNNLHVLEVQCDCPAQKAVHKLSVELVIVEMIIIIFSTLGKHC